VKKEGKNKKIWKEKSPGMAGWPRKLASGGIVQGSRVRRIIVFFRGEEKIAGTG